MGLLTPLIRTYLAESASSIHGRLLDVGCGDEPYRDLFLNVDEYIGVDFPDDCVIGTSISDRNRLNYVARAENLPFTNASFDAVLATQLLEHLPSPTLFVQEASRILKTNGKIITTFPLVNPIHERPRDYYRYTEFGARYLFQEHGFVIEKICGMGGFWLAVGFLLYNFCYTESNKSNGYRKYLLHRLGTLSYDFFTRMDRRYFYPDLPVNYLLVAIKS